MSYETQLRRSRQPSETAVENKVEVRPHLLLTLRKLARGLTLAVAYSEETTRQLRNQAQCELKLGNASQCGIVLRLVGLNLRVEVGQLSVAAIVLPIL